jgi:Fe-S-cluster containining protein
VTPGEKLCLACGLCCDGTLFNHVKLGPRDNTRRLSDLGLPVAVTSSSRPVIHSRQPCAALCADCTCRIYADRPAQCRSFECGVFRDAQSGRTPFATAKRLVQKARRQADRIRQLLRQLGDKDEHRSLVERFTRTTRRIEANPSSTDVAELFSELSLAMHALNLLAHEKFHDKPRTK